MKRGALPVKDKITVWGTEDCRFCHMAEDLARSKGFEVESIEASQDMFKFSKLFPNVKTVPQILIGDTWIGGYSDLKEVLESIE
jgi:glutaredoxin